MAAATAAAVAVSAVRVVGDQIALHERQQLAAGDGPGGGGGEVAAAATARALDAIPAAAAHTALASTAAAMAMDAATQPAPGAMAAGAPAELTAVPHGDLEAPCGHAGPPGPPTAPATAAAAAAAAGESGETPGQRSMRSACRQLLDEILACQPGQAAAAAATAVATQALSEALHRHPLARGGSTGLAREPGGGGVAGGVAGGEAPQTHTQAGSDLHARQGVMPSGLDTLAAVQSVQQAAEDAAAAAMSLAGPVGGGPVAQQVAGPGGEEGPSFE
jgi:hypothetical protein